MQQGRPVRAIAEAEGLKPDYVRKRCTELSNKHALDYKPENIANLTLVTPIGITEESKEFRTRLADRLTKLVSKNGDHRGEAAHILGMTMRSQGYAKERPYNHDWSISQIERLARATGTTFESLVASCLTK